LRLGLELRSPSRAWSGAPTKTEFGVFEVSHKIWLLATTFFLTKMMTENSDRKV